MTDLRELRKKREAEYENQIRQPENSQDQQARFQQEIAQLEQSIKLIMTKDALTRYGALKSGHPQLAVQALVGIARQVEAGRIKQVTDSVLKELLREFQNRKHNITIRRK